MKKSHKNPIQYVCEACDYVTKVKKDYNKHLLTRKHQNRTNSNENIPDKNDFECPLCMKIYKSRSSLWYHKKKCDGILLCEKATTDYKKDNIFVENIIEVDSTNYTETNKQIQHNNDTNDIKETNSILHQMMEENKELRNMISEQQKQIGEIIPKIGNTTNKFNLNVFLNEHCKDAISLHDFISNLQLCPEDLEDTGKLGYVDGIAKIINRGLQEMELTKRPIHCSDIKREVLYVKENDVWEKEHMEKNRMRKAIEYISRANIKQIPAWVEANPDSQQYGNSKNDEFNSIIDNVVDTDDTEEHSKNFNKIIKNVAKNVVLDKITDV